MASYKDITPSTFSPYVPTRPVEAMMRVGMYKQQKFDEGLKKIQDNIDNVAGLDVVRPEDKEYLQSKLNQLGGQISNMAGGDFSNFSLVNSVNGMTNQIVKDPAIMNAVSNTARYKKDLTTVDKLQSEGKWAPSNQAAFQKDVNNWFQGGKNSTYNANVSPYVNVTKDATEIIKALGVKETGRDVAFNEKGQLVDAITRVRVKGISKERIASALKSGLSPQAYRQLSIDGLYKYSNTSPEQYVNDVNSSYQSTFTKYSEDRDRLVALKNAAASPSEQQRIQGEIDQIDSSIESIKSEYDSVSQGFSNGDVEGSQAQLYTMNWLQDTSNAYATKSVIQSYQTNPMARMQLERDKMRQTAAIAQAKLNQQKTYNDKQIEIENEKLKLLKDPYGAVELPQGEEATNVEVIAAAKANETAALNLTEKVKSQFINKFVDSEERTKLINLRDSTKNPIEKQRIQDEINKLDEEAFNLNLSLYRTKPNSVPWDQAQILNQYDVAQKNSVRQSNLILQAEQEAKAIADSKYADLIPEDLKNSTINGMNYAQAAALIDRFNNDYYIVGGRSSNFEPNYSQLKAKKDFEAGLLTEEEYGLYELWAMSEREAEDIQTLNNVNSIIRRGAQQIEEERDTYLKDFYRKTMPITSQQAYRVPLGSAEQKDEFRPTLNSLAAMAERIGGLPGFEGTAEDIRLMASGLQGALVYTDGAGDYQINVTNEAGQSLTIPITGDTYRSVFGDRFEASPEMKAFNQKYLPQMLAHIPPLEIRYDPRVNKDVFMRPPQDFFTTSLDGQYKTTVDNSSLSGPSDFPRVSYYVVTGNIVSDSEPEAAEQFKLQLNIFDPISNKQVSENYLFPTSILKEKVVPTLQQITDEAIWQLLNDTTKNMPDSELKKLQEASKTID